MPHSFAEDELSTLDLGDRRRTARGLRFIDQILAKPAASFPQIAGDNANLEAAYRLMNNDAVRFEAFLDAHGASSWRRCVEAGASVLVLHDTSEVVFPRESERSGLTQKGGTQSFHAHVALAVAEGDLPMVHGVVGVLPTILRDGSWFEVRGDDREVEMWSGADRWLTLAGRVHADAPQEQSIIHVMDREADDYSLWSTIVEQGDEFVIRSKHNRNLSNDEKLRAALSGLEFRIERTVPISRRGGKRLPATRKTHPDRDQRNARLSIRAGRVEILRPRGVAPTGTPTMTLSAVEVVELDPPKGAAPIHWILLTTLPVETIEQVLRVVDIYRKRWLIEEFFKSLKTGCSLQRRQGRTRQVLLTAMSMLIPVAWRLLLLRQMSRASPKESADGVLSPIEIIALRKLAPSAKLGRVPKLRAVLLAVAALGGHLKSNGEPGWLTLGRGLERLLTYAQGWEAAMREMEQAGEYLM